MIIRIILCSLIALNSYALNPDNNFFIKSGKLSSFKYKPMNSPLSFEYDVFYYIPRALRNAKNLKVLTFLHGGGPSTLTRRGSNQTIKDYASDLIQMAIDQKFVLVLPSGSGLNWGSHTLNYLRQLNISIKKELPVNVNKMGLSGHSMGAMAITRTAHWLTDQYSFFLSIAGGMPKSYAKDEYLSTYFNTNYIHQQGTRDHLKSFLPLSLEARGKVELLEKKYNKKSGYFLSVYKGSHNYKISLFKRDLNRLFLKDKNMYQKELKGVFYNRDEILMDKWSNNIEFYQSPRDSYFWLKVKEFNSEKVVIPVIANITNNTININIKNGVKTLRVLLSSQMLDLNKSLTIRVNGKIKYEDFAPVKSTTSAMEYSTFIDLNL